MVRCMRWGETLATVTPRKPAYRTSLVTAAAGCGPGLTGRRAWVLERVGLHGCARAELHVTLEN